MTSADTSGRRYVVGGIVWLLVAIALGASGHVATWRPPTPQLVLVGLTILLLAVFAVSARLRQWLRGLDLRWLIALHLTRFVGFYFLLLYYRDGALPWAFAVPGGWGDIVVAALAVALLALGRDLPRRQGLVGLWNALGLVDILMVVVTAARIAFADPDALNALLRLPLSLLVTFLVPLIIAGHVVVFYRLGLTPDLERRRT